MGLKNSVLDGIKGSLKLRNKLCFELGIHSVTLDRWVKENSDNLTKAKALEIISEFLGKPEKELLA